MYACNNNWILSQRAAWKWQRIVRYWVNWMEEPFSASWPSCTTANGQHLWKVCSWHDESDNLCARWCFDRFFFLLSCCSYRQCKAMDYRSPCVSNHHDENRNDETSWTYCISQKVCTKCYRLLTSLHSVLLHVQQLINLTANYFVYHTKNSTILLPCAPCCVPCEVNFLLCPNT